MTKRLPKGRKYKRGRVWYSAFKYQGVPHRESLNTRDALVAEKRLQKKMSKVRDQIRNGEFLPDDVPVELALLSDCVTLSEAWATFRDSSLRRKCSLQTLRQYECQYGRFQRWVADNDQSVQSLADISPDIGEKFLSELHTVEELSSNTRNKYLRLMKYIWRIVTAEFKRKHRGEAVRVPFDNPWADIPATGEVQEQRSEFSLTMAKTLIASASDWMRTLLILGLYTGQRLKDCCLLTWVQVDWDAGVITVRPYKTRSASRNGAGTVRLPMLPELRRHLSEMRKADNVVIQGYVLREVATEYLRDRSSVTRDIQAFLQSQGIQTLREAETDIRKRKVITFGFHSLKHCFVTVCTERGVPAHVIEKIAGHSYRLYQHVQASDMRQVVRALSSDEPDTVCPNCGGRGLDSYSIDELRQELARRVDVVKAERVLA